MATRVPNVFAPTDNRSAAKVMENFDYITGRLDLVEAWFATTNPLIAANSVIGAQGPAFAQLSLQDLGAVSDRKRSKLHNDGGHTALIAPDDADVNILRTGFDFNHSTGVVDFPNGLSSGGAGLGSAFDSRGKSIIAAAESRANVAYGKLTTPDQVTVTLAVDGLIKVLFQATWQESVIGAARAAIFLGANQLKAATSGGAAGVATEAAYVDGAATANRDYPLSSFPGGLMSGAGGGAAYPGDVATGQVVGIQTPPDIEQGGFPLGMGTDNDFIGGPCYIFAAAGTYTISVQFKASSGSVTAKNRKLWVAAETY